MNEIFLKLISPQLITIVLYFNIKPIKNLQILNINLLITYFNR